MGAYKTPADLKAFVFKDNYVGVEKTTSPHHTAHPDSTLLVAGLPRYTSNEGSGGDMHFVGATNTMAIMESQNVQPLKELGSSRFIMTTTNAPVSLRCNSLLINGPNLLKSLYASALKLGITGLDTQNFSIMNEDGYGGWCNLDYPIFSVPFGLGIISRSTASQDVMSVYAEDCLIQSWSWNVTAGSASVMTDVAIICDRVLPLKWSGLNKVNGTTIENMLNTLATGNAAGTIDGVGPNF